MDKQLELRNEIDDIERAYKKFKKKSNALIGNIIIAHLGIIFLIIKEVLDVLKTSYSNSSTFGSIVLTSILPLIFILAGGLAALILSIIIPTKYGRIYGQISSTPTVLIILGIFILTIILTPIGLSIASSNFKKLIKDKQNELLNIQYMQSNFVNNQNSTPLNNPSQS
ncbi:hypothetical protein [Mycoplasma sp. E35C]|uniref:hypothetical protein n=1 Tax=Mycoplasma sp. E35C TaxID=2801918 RepID=UPI001CA39827|nr:hypothetical protein [Mycoplasma sp. E35C]QZX49094.1 hypothetical protein JJE79_03505 [Mycoplasma sp. E35C]